MHLEAELTERETEIAELLAWGAAKKEVADELNISPRTVENTARSIYFKIGIQKATELCVWWFCTRFKVPLNMSPLARKGVAVLVLIAVPGIFLQEDGKFLRAERSAARRIVRREFDFNQT